MVNTAVLVFIAGALMGFSRICGSPEMVIIGRFITGIHSGKEIKIPGHKVKMHIYLSCGVQLQVSPKRKSLISALWRSVQS